MRRALALLVLAPLPAAADDFVRTPAPRAVIMDADTGAVLWGKAADQPMPPASMSKLMTAAVVLDLIDQGVIADDTPFEVSERAWRTGGSKMFVLVDTTIPVIDLLRGLIVQSGNDAAVVLAENVAGGDEAFAKLMNAKAAEWGLTESRFANPTGLDDPEQRMSPRDLGKLTKLIWDRYPEHRDLFAMPAFTWSNIEQTNRNPLIGTFEGAQGMKTGYTEEAGYSLTGLAERGDERRIVVVAGLDSEAARRRAADRLMTTAFDEYDTHTLLRAGEVVGEAPVFAGTAESVPLTVRSDLTFTLHHRSLDGAEATLSYDAPLPAPVRAGERVGVMHLTMPGEETREYPVYAAADVPGLSAWSKIGLGLRKLLTPPEDPAF